MKNPIQALRAELELLETYLGPNGLLGQRPNDAEQEKAARARMASLREAIQKSEVQK